MEGHTGTANWRHLKCTLSFLNWLGSNYLAYSKGAGCASGSSQILYTEYVGWTEYASCTFGIFTQFD